MTSKNTSPKRSASARKREKVATATRRGRIARFTAVLGAFVVLCTAWALMVPAVTITGDKAQPDAGFFAGSDAASVSAAQGGGSAAVLGNVSDTQVNYQPGASTTLAMPAQTFEEQVTTSDGSVLTVHVDADEGTFADGVQMRVAEVDDDDVIETAKGAAADNTDMSAEDAQAVAVDITFADADGNEVQPAKDVHVTMTTSAIAQSSDLAVVHVDSEQNAAVVESTAPAATASDEAADTESEGAAASDAVTFEASSFSVYAIVYTVDFEYEANGKTYQFSIQGGGKIALSDLAEVLGIIGDSNDEEEAAFTSVDSFLEEVANVEFSDESLVKVTRSEGDWELESLQAFDTEETLTITMASGDVTTVKVTDAQNGGRSTVTGKLMRYQDAFPNGQYVLFTESNGNYYALTNFGGAVKIIYNSSTGNISYTGDESIIWDSKYVGRADWPNHYELVAVDNSQWNSRWYLNPGADPYNFSNNNNLLRQWYGRVYMEKRSPNNTAAFKVKGEEGGTKYLGWSNGNFAATDYDTNSIYLAKVEDVSTRYSFTVTVDDPSHGKVSGTYDNGISTGDVTSFTVTTESVNAEGFGNYDASSRPIAAKAAEGYTFSHWEVDNSRYTDDRVLNGTLGMASDNVVLKAVFKKDTTVTDEMTKEQIEDQLTAWASDMMSDSITTNKTAQVSDYENRIYEITMSASSGIRRAMPTVDLTFITDVSRSMFFPATLEEVATFTQGTAHEANPGPHQTATGEWVDADSSLYDWLNRYGDKNTVYYTISDNAQATVMAVYYDLNYYNPADTVRTGVWRYYDSSNVNPPDAQNHAGNVLNSTGKNEPWGKNLTGKLYKQVGTLNRMDYLKMAAEAASSVVFGVDPDARVGLVTFAASANEGQFYDNNSDFTNALEAVDLTGGTNQGDGLNKGADLFSNNNRENPVPKRVAILITDGAPNQKDVNWGTITQSATNLKNLYGTDSIELYTLGLSMSMVGTENQNGLKGIATGGVDGGHWAMAENGASIVEALKKIIDTIVNEASLKGTITDQIDEAFYPVSADTNEPLQAGQMIDLNGKKITQIPADGKYGIITNDGANYGVQWSDQVVAYSADGEPTWEGKIFVKAKEDFLGGNSINTNKGDGDKFVPTKYIVDGQEYNLRDGDEAKLTRTFATPYVNVDELSMTQNSSEWTVYLGTEVSPKEQIEALLDKVDIREVVSSSTNHMMTDASAMLGSSTTDASETFPLKEVLGQDGLSSDEWNQLVDQGHLDIPYFAYGHEEVGTLSLSLTKIGDTANCEKHTTTKVGDSVEQYILTASYYPAAKKDVDYKTTPGGSPGALTGVMRSDNTHVINVYDLPLDVYKTDGKGGALAGATFTLYKVDDQKGSAVIGLNSAHKYIEVASATSGDDGVARLSKDGAPFGLAQGETYYLIETDAPENYVKSSTVWTVVVQTEIGKYTDLSGAAIYSSADDGAVTGDMYPFNWDQGAMAMLDGNQPLTVVVKGETEGETATIEGGSYVSHTSAVAFRHTVDNLGGKVDIHAHKTWNTEGETPESVTVTLYRVSEKGHHWGEGTVVPCTCTDNGVKEYTCSECGVTDTEAISAAGHTPGEPHRENEIAATCTNVGGYDTVVRCKVCNAIISTEHTNVQATGHTWVNQEVASTDSTKCYDTVNVCSVCGAVDEGTRVHHDHEWGDWEVTTPAQPGVAGVETRVCNHDSSHVETQTIPALPNNTKIHYITYRDWYTDGWREDDVITTETYPIGSSITLTWKSNAHEYASYDATVYINGTATWDRQNGYVLSGDSVKATKTGQSYDYTYSVTVTVTDGMTLFLKSSRWDDYPTNITITQNRSNALNSNARKAATFSSKASLSKSARLNANPAPLLGADASTGSMTQSQLETYLADLKEKNEATCKNEEGAVHTYKEAVKTYTFGAGDDGQWNLDITKLPKYNEYGNEYTYYLVEAPVTGYDTTYSGQDTGLKDDETDLQIINTPKTTSLSVTKSWAFANPSNVTKVEGKEWPAGVTVHVVVYSKTGENDPVPTDYAEDLTADQPTYTFTGLPEYSGNDKIVYSVVEAGVTGLDSTNFNTVIEGNAEDGYTIKNTEKEAGLTIFKAFEGDSLTDAQKNAITFTVTGPGLRDRSSGNSVDSLTKTYADFTEGRWVLNNADGIVNGNTYTVTETNANFEHYTRVTTVKTNDAEAASFAQDGEGTAPSGSVTISGHQGTVAITNTYTRLLDLKIIKVDEEGMATPLKGAKFELRRIDPNSAAISYLDDAATLPNTTGEDHKTGDNGEAIFTDLAPGYYEVKETELPAGYIQTENGVFYIKVENGAVSHVKRTVTEDDVTWEPGVNNSTFMFTAASGNAPATATVGNTPGPELPLTGGPGTTAALFAGIVLTIVGISILLFRRRPAVVPAHRNPNIRRTGRRGGR